MILEKSNTINIWRIIFTLGIVFFHYFEGTRPLGGYIYVEFFFIVSGYLIALKKNEKEVDFHSFMRHRFGAIYPSFIIAFISVYIIKVYFLKLHDSAFFRNLKESFLELSLVYMTGMIPAFRYCNPAWYLSVLLLGGGLIYFCLKYHEKVYKNILCISFVLLIYTYFYQTLGHVQTIYEYKFLVTTGIFLK